MKPFFSILLIFSLLACKSIPKGEVADSIYYNGNIISMEGEEEIASSIAVKEGKILAIDTKSLLPKHQGDSTKIIDLEGKTLLPGFIDAHSHISFGMAVIAMANLSSPPVGEVQNIGDILSRLKAHQEINNIPKGAWISGWGYDPDLLEEKRHPNKLDLDAIFPENPVFLTHVSGHMAVVNSVALELLDINSHTPNPPGGMIVRLSNSEEPNGLLQETAMQIARKALPNPNPEQAIFLMEKTQELYASHGITTAQDGFTDYKNFQFFQQLAEAGKLILDVEILASFVDLQDYLENHGTEFGQSKNRLRLAGVKVISDGSPQGKTAYFRKPYLTKVPGCLHECRGFPNLSGDQLGRIMQACYEAGIQLFTHANGDGAIDLLLDTHQAVLDSMEQIPEDMRNVIIHSQFVRTDQLKLYKKYEMIPAYFSNHAFFWGDTHLKNLGEERANF
ncbi:MAG: amidohydrolase, partial [Bacteroidota bacterium]